MVAAVSEWLAVAAVVVAGLSGLPGLVMSRHGRAGERVAALAMGVAGVLGLGAGFEALARGPASPLEARWPVPAGRLAVEVDALSAMFVIQIAGIAALASVYGLEYWAQRSHPANGRRLRACYGAATAGMLLLVIARNAVLFLFGWEVMALAAFLLVATEDDDPEVRDAGRVYLLATRFGTLALFAMFALLGAASGTLDFQGWPRALASPLSGAIFVLALVGFGLKAGIMPLHLWLPGAHASAPSHVSALMSGVLIKMGIYGLVRVTSLCAQPPPWWGYALIALGVVSGVLGVASALGQHDLKRLLAYHSVENIGIICIGLGVALLGRALGRGELVALGLGGALLHTWNHGLFKALLFLSAGSVVHATGTREIDRLGGLGRRMPLTALAFGVGAVAICGLPPLNGLVSEFLVYLGLFGAATLASADGAWIAAALAAPALALVGGLAIACFVKVVGAVFLGESRSPDSAHAHEAGAAMLAPMAVLASCCLFIGIGAPLVAPILDRASAAWTSGAETPVLAQTSLTRLAPLGSLATASAAILAATATLGAWLLVRTRRAPSGVGTWDCGYATPSPRMQYTSSSFADTLVRLFAWALRPKVDAARVEGVFPAPTSFHSHVPDTVLSGVVRPAFAAAGGAFGWLRLIQRGNVHLYLLYILTTLVLLLLWR